MSEPTGVTVPILYHPEQHTTSTLSSSGLIRVRSLSGICLIDTSGSTQKHHVLQDELALVRSFQYQYNVSWSDDAFLYGHDKVDIYTSLRSEGGTEPARLFDKPLIIDQLLRSQVIVFSTDGKVESGDIAEFARQVNTYFGHASLIVCVVAGTRTVEEKDSFSSVVKRQRVEPNRAVPIHSVGISEESEILTDPKDVNLSVFASLLTFPNVLVVHVHYGVYRLLRASLSMSTILKEQLNIDVPVDDSHNWRTLPQLEPAQILALDIPMNTRAPIPDGYRLLPNGIAVHLERLLSSGGGKQDEEVYQCLKQCFQAVILHCRNEGSLERLKTWLEQQGKYVEDEGWMERVEQALLTDDDEFYSSSSVSAFMASQ